MQTQLDISVAKERQLSFRTTPEVKRLARIEAAKQGMSLGEWLNKIVQDNLPEQKGASMTYPCPSLVRDHRYSVNLNEPEDALILAIANYQGKAPSTIIRELALAKAIQDLSLEPIANDQLNEVAKKLR